LFKVITASCRRLLCVTCTPWPYALVPLVWRTILVMHEQVVLQATMYL